MTDPQPADDNNQPADAPASDTGKPQVAPSASAETAAESTAEAIDHPAAEPPASGEDWSCDEQMEIPL